MLGHVSRAFQLGSARRLPGCRDTRYGHVAEYFRLYADALSEC